MRYRATVFEAGNLPELKTSYGYFVILAVIAVMCIAFFIRFKRARRI